MVQDTILSLLDKLEDKCDERCRIVMTSSGRGHVELLAWDYDKVLFGFESIDDFEKKVLNFKYE